MSSDVEGSSACLKSFLDLDVVRGIEISFFGRILVIEFLTDGY